MPDVFSIQYTEATRQKYLKYGEESLFFFAQGILGFKDLAERPHLELCENLLGRGTWGPWNRAVVCAARGFLKSSICTIAFPLHQSIYRMDYSCRILGASHENIKINFFRKMVQVFTVSHRRNFLCWLYAHRLPPDFEGWTDSQIKFIAEDPLASPSITYKGIASDQEGYHGEAVIVDDPEGADAEKSRTVNVDAERAIDSAIPLLKDPNKDQLLCILTPWGANPLAYKLRDRKGWKVWWMPIVDGAGKSNWPGRFPDDSVDLLRAGTPKDIWNSQYLLKRPSEGRTLLNRDAIEASMYTWKIKGKVIQYPAIETDMKAYSLGQADGKYAEGIKIVQRTVDIQSMRFFLHIDPVHKVDPTSKKFSGTARDAKAALVVVGISPDFHAFVMEYFTERVDLDAQLQHSYHFYRKYGCYKVTFDPIGAQVWFRDYALQKERSDVRYRNLESLGSIQPRRLLPSLTSRLVEDKRTARLSKEAVIAERLEPWFSGCQLHIREDQDELKAQLFGFPDDQEFIDLVDALAQGPPKDCWSPPLQADLIRNRQRKNNAFPYKRDKQTGYYNPYAAKEIEGKKTV